MDIISVDLFSNRGLFFRGRFFHGPFFRIPCYIHLRASWPHKGRRALRIRGIVWRNDNNMTPPMQSRGHIDSTVQPAGECFWGGAGDSFVAVSASLGSRNGHTDQWIRLPACGFLLVFCINHSPEMRRTDGRLTALLNAATEGRGLINQCAVIGLLSRVESHTHTHTRTCRDLSWLHLVRGVFYSRSLIDWLSDRVETTAKLGKGVEPPPHLPPDPPWDWDSHKTDKKFGDPLPNE